MVEVAAPAPAVEILDKRETVTRLYELIEQAERRLLLISPYISLDKLRDLYRALDATLDKKTVKATLVGRDCPHEDNFIMKSDLLPTLQAKGLEVRIVKDLHAKMYVSEKAALVTSLNLTDSSMNNSIEVGMWIAAGTSAYGELIRVWKQQRAEPVIQGSKAPRSRQGAALGGLPWERGRTNQTTPEGSCIRCGTEIDLDDARPFCRECYAVFSHRGSPTTKQKFCHECGRDEKTSFAKPLCDDCFYG